MTWIVIFGAIVGFIIGSLISFPIGGIIFAIVGALLAEVSLNENI